ncbi:hypothetical protein AAFF_G00183730 [Aldrovandia affinis]|uniref:Uncharacterized protein n=1 Tax=Aldrovandia affinis TaxID=143900 RepID=A0AAD7RKA7_9TELE|nr:hypothetical protein AAFF_G00183730 [Aldrovandia affinis]
MSDSSKDGETTLSSRSIVILKRQQPTAAGPPLRRRLRMAGPAVVRSYPNSKARVTMSPGFTAQWNSSQQGAAWGSYAVSRAGLHYQGPHAGYAYCPGHPAVSPRLLYPPDYILLPRPVIYTAPCWSRCAVPLSQRSVVSPLAWRRGRPVERQRGLNVSPSCWSTVHLDGRLFSV